MPRGRKPGTGRRQQSSHSEGLELEPETRDDSATVVVPRSEGFVHNKLPSDLKHLRACMVCSLVKMESEFDEVGCENCERKISQAAGQCLPYHQYTSANFHGLVATIYPMDSWVAKWQRVAHLKPGLYAVSVNGRLEKWLKDALTEAGIPTKSRTQDCQD